MATYLVRIVGLKRLVGIYVASSISYLQDVVDEQTDPGECEYITLKNGGGISTGRNTTR